MIESRFDTNTFLTDFVQLVFRRHEALQEAFLRKANHDVRGALSPIKALASSLQRPIAGQTETISRLLVRSIDRCIETLSDLLSPSALRSSVYAQTNRREGFAEGVVKFLDRLASTTGVDGGVTYVGNRLARDTKTHAFIDVWLHLVIQYCQGWAGSAKLVPHLTIEVSGGRCSFNLAFALKGQPEALSMIGEGTEHLVQIANSVCRQYGVVVSVQPSSLSIECPAAAQSTSERLDVVCRSVATIVGMGSEYLQRAQALTALADLPLRFRYDSTTSAHPEVEVLVEYPESEDGVDTSVQVEHVRVTIGEGLTLGRLSKLFHFLQSLAVSSARAEHTETTEDNVEGPRILIVDDDPNTLNLHSMLFRRLGQAVVCADSIPDALNILLSHSIHTIICDLYVGDTLATSLYEDLANSRSSHTVQFFVISSARADHARREFPHDTTVTFLEKPLVEAQARAVLAKARQDRTMRIDPTSDYR